MSQVKTLLEKAVGEIVGAAGCPDISKASLQFNRRHSLPVVVEVIRVGDVFEALVGNEQSCTSNNALQLISVLVDICADEIQDDNRAEVLLRAESTDSSRFIPASRAILRDGKVVFEQVNADMIALLDKGVQLVQEKLAAAEISSARIMLNDGRNYWTICLSPSCAYSNDFDLFVGAPPSFHCESSQPAVTRARILAFLSERFAAADYLQVRLLMDSNFGARQENLLADSRQGGNFAEPVVFDPPV